MTTDAYLFRILETLIKKSLRHTLTEDEVLFYNQALSTIKQKLRLEEQIMRDENDRLEETCSCKDQQTEELRENTIETDSG